jgi:large subunit ribosomal protein L4
MNKKTKRVALFSALSAKVAEGKLIIVDDIACTEYKTKTMVNMLKALGVDNRALVVLDTINPFTVKSCANIERVETTLATTINVYEIMKADKMVITAAAVKKLEEVYA